MVIVPCPLNFFNLPCYTGARRRRARDIHMENFLTTDIVILGAGIGGYETFRTLARLLKRNGAKQRILLVDENNYFTFVPLLHEVASGAVEPSHAAVPLRELVYKTPHRFLKAAVTRVDPEQKIVLTARGEIRYRFCVLGLGSTVNYFGVPGAAEFTFCVRTLAEATHFRRRLIDRFESDDERIDVVIVGAGYTGVEVAGQLGHLMKRDIKKLYPEKKMTITIVEAGDSLIPQLPPPARQKIQHRLAKMTVTIRFNAKVKDVTAAGVTVNDNETLPSDLTVWCAGVKNTVGQYLPEGLTEKGRLPVNHFLQHQCYPELYGVGDDIVGINAGDAIPYPQLGEAARREGKYVAQHIAATLAHRSLPPFFFKSKGMLIPIGDRWGVMVSGRWVVYGLIAWWIRRTVYLLFMPGFIRRLKIVLDWTLRLFGFSYIIAIDPKNNFRPRRIPG